MAHGTLHDTDLNNVWEILTKYWDLPIPKLLISVTGGAKRFEMKPRLKNILKQGLCHAATSTGAWIITGGTGTGIMQIVGEAIHEYMMAHGVQDQKLVALGIATWGIVSNRSALVGKSDKGLFPATYASEDVQADTRGAPLDHNHTHFILVDNGTENIYGGEIKFRTALESYISKKVVTGVAQNQSVHVPNVLLVVEGGVNTMATVSESIRQKIPVVIIEGTGKAADFISLGFNKSQSNKKNPEKTDFPNEFDEDMKEKARKMFVWNKETENDKKKKIDDCLRSLKELLQLKNYSKCLMLAYLVLFELVLDV
ncbi:transient receptor potential cation channel subfamily M member-like 2 [Gigantopelta aegis]|uniref:transient receptor potential cation channel subfamily M member-like 2 n=1 Tax=Gigantopelta aegis TaxID=1735272 RepID=UPI001B88D373|nr:transient receptor potential cation channel subfamily M member-like 2 [Gigantopelta aegis]